MEHGDTPGIVRVIQSNAIGLRSVPGDCRSPSISTILEQTTYKRVTRVTLQLRQLVVHPGQRPIAAPLIDQLINRIYQFWQQYPDAEYIKSAVVAIGQTWEILVQVLQTALEDEDLDVTRSAVDALRSAMRRLLMPCSRRSSMRTQTLDSEQQMH